MRQLQCQIANRHFQALTLTFRPKPARAGSSTRPELNAVTPRYSWIAANLNVTHQKVSKH
jgi:hypothetical protein